MRQGRALEAASALRGRAVISFNNGHPGSALRLIERGFATIADSDVASDDPARRQLEIELWISRALVEAEVYGLERGLRCLAAAQESATGFAADGLVARIHSQAAAIAMRAGLWEKARDELGHAERLIDSADENDQFAILLNSGSLRLFRGELVGTRTALDRALQHARRAERSDWILKAAHNLGYTEFLAGNLPAALALMSEALTVDADVSRGVPLLDRARVLVESGLVREADETLAHAAEIFAAERATQDLGETELERARCALAAGDVQLARRVAVRARNRFRRRGNEEWRRSAELVLSQASLAAGVPPRRLVEPVERLAAELGAAGLRLHARAAGLVMSEVHLALGATSAAVDALDAVGAPRRDDPITGRMHWHYVSARVAAAAGNTTTASRRTRSALDELARYQASFGSLDLRTASAVHGRRLAELDVALALRTRRAASVFTAAERARAVSSRLAPVRPPDDPVAAELLAELRQVLESLRAVEYDKSASEPLLRKRRELERQIVARSWTVSGTGAVAKQVSLDQVRAELTDDGQAMVMYVQAEGKLSAVVLGTKTTLHDLGSSGPVLEQVRRVRVDLDMLAHPTVPPGIRQAATASLRRSLERLERALVTPLRVDGPLVLVSTGVLGQLPWASLAALRGRPIVVAPSATKWLASSQQPGVTKSRVAALAGPDLGRGQEEAAAVGTMWSASRVVPVATRADLLDAMAATDVLHVAAHGVHQPENPLFSSVRMVDGPVFAHELDQRGHAPQHVVLSACEVGLATIRPGDEALGLATVLLNLGTQSVVAGVARVGDEVAEQTMAAYHAKLAAGADSAGALAGALAETDADVVPPFVNFGAAWAAPHPG